jgi:hypothetical protein
MEDMRNSHRIFIRKRKDTDDLGDLGLDWSMILKWNLKSRMAECAFDPPVSVQGAVAYCCEHDVELSGCMK